jgi:hypothetical protein
MRNKLTPEERKAKRVAYQREYRLRNKEAEAEKCRKWREANRDKVAEYEASRKDKALARLKAWRAANPDFKLRENHRRRDRLKGDLSVGIKEKLISMQKGKCAIRSYIHEKRTI